MDLLAFSNETLPNYSNKKALIIDDQQLTRDVIAQDLRDTIKIQKITSAHTPSDAISMVKLQVFDVILCDYNLGSDKKDGQQVLEEMRTCNYIPPSTVFFMITADSTFENVIAATEHAPDEYILKPYIPNVFINRLISCFERKEIFL
jgi:CheY-like chemotaxis protein